MSALFTNPASFFSDIDFSNPSAVQPMSFTQTLISNAASTGEDILKNVFAVPNVPSGQSYLSTVSPNGARTTEVIGNGTGFTSLGLGTSIMPLVLIGGLGLVLLLALKK